MTLPILILGSLATYRLALLITEDRITYPLRALFGVRRDGDAEIVPEDESWESYVAYLLSCIRCASVWAAFVVTLPIAWSTGTMDDYKALVLPLACSGGAIAIDAWVRRR